jgi:DNA replication protein DnaC
MAKQNPTPRTPKQTPAAVRRSLLEHFQTLKIRVTDQQLDAALARAEQEGLSHLQFVHCLIADQAAQRRQRSIERRIRDACFRDQGTLESFDWKFNEKTIDRARMEELATGEFVKRADNLVMVGQSGVGKSRLIQGIAQRHCLLGYRVRYITSAALVNDLAASRAGETLPQRLRYFSNFDLLVIDEFGFEKLERVDHPQAASLLYKVIEARYPRRSTALVTNIEFEAWSDYLEDPPLAMALLDRILDSAIVLKLEWKSYRAHRARRVDVKPPASA